MDWQNALNFLGGIVCTVLGWLLQVLREAHREMASQLRALEISLPTNYASKDEVEKLTDALFRKLDRMHETQLEILRALDGKADRDDARGKKT